MKKELLDLAAKQGACAAGFCGARVFDELTDSLLKNPASMAKGSARERVNPFLIMPGAKSIMVCLFSYNNGSKTGNLSCYAFGADYHETLARRMQPICEAIREKGYFAEYLCDNNPLCERYLAYLSGLGFFGRNCMLINPVWGSYTFIGCIITDAEIEPDAPLCRTCAECGECERECPGGAISREGFCEEKCASYLTQKKGELSKDERSIIKKSSFAWGCDICQSVCPHNKAAPRTEIEEFKSELITSLSEDMADSGRDFRRRYKNRAFSWRGFGVILRNLGILREE